MEPVSWIKWKYACPKQRGRYSGGTHNGPPKKRKKVGSKIKPTQRRVKIIQANGRVAWDWQPV
jgi:hypothetical protein